MATLKTWKLMIFLVFLLYYSTFIWWYTFHKYITLIIKVYYAPTHEQLGSSVLPKSATYTHQQRHDQYMQPHHHWFNHTLMNHNFTSWIKIDQLDVTCFIISLFTVQRVSNVSTAIFRSLRLIVDYFMCSITLVRWNISIIIRKLLKMDVLTFETCWAVNSEIIKTEALVLQPA